MGFYHIASQMGFYHIGSQMGFYRIDSHPCVNGEASTLHADCGITKQSIRTESELIGPELDPECIKKKSWRRSMKAFIWMT